jgi:type IV secretory pathway protease TraF
VALVLVLLLRAFVGDVYRISSSSMEPTLAEGERVFVLYSDAPPDRFDLVVLTRDEGALVKRVAGLPGERVEIGSGGDLLIDGARLPRDAARPTPILVFDSKLLDLEANFRMGSSTSNPWTRTDNGWELDARATQAHAAVGLIGPHKGVHDEWLGRDGKLVRPPGPIDVGDLIVEADFRPLDAGGRIVLRLDEQGDVFRFLVEIKEGGIGRASIRRYFAGDVKTEEVLVESDVPLRLGEWIGLHAENIDNHLRFLRTDGRVLLEADYDENRLLPRDLAGQGSSLGERVQLGGEGCRLRLGRVRIWRDLHYTPQGDYAVRRPARLGPGEYFLLGDNSGASRDGREWGAVQAKNLFGRALWVVWPPSAIRRL